MDLKIRHCYKKWIDYIVVIKNEQVKTMDQ